MSEAIPVSTVDLSAVTWRKSSYTGDGDKGDCVEIGFVPDSAWRTSGYTGDGSNGNCVEVAFVPEAVAVRDTKNRTGGVLMFGQRTWTDLLRTVRG